jgi:hypothetical protein
MASSCVSDVEPLGSTQGGEFFYRLTNYQLKTKVYTVELQYSTCKFLTNSLARIQ